MYCTTAHVVLFLYSWEGKQIYQGMELHGHKILIISDASPLMNFSNELNSNSLNTYRFSCFTNEFSLVN